MNEDEIKDTDGKTFFYQKHYVPETARFKDPLPDAECLRKERSHRFCSACVRLRTLEQFNTPKVCNINVFLHNYCFYYVYIYKGE